METERFLSVDFLSIRPNGVPADPQQNSRLGLRESARCLGFLAQRLNAVETRERGDY